MNVEELKDKWVKFEKLSAATASPSLNNPIISLMGFGLHTCDVVAVKIKKVVFNFPATIVYWEDGTKTVVKCQDGDIWDDEKGVLAAMAKRAYGNDNTYNKELAKWLPNPPTSAKILHELCGSAVKHAADVISSLTIKEVDDGTD